MTRRWTINQNRCDEHLIERQRAKFKPKPKPKDEKR